MYVRHKWPECNIYGMDDDRGSWNCLQYVTIQLPQMIASLTVSSEFSGIYTRWHSPNQNNLRNLKYAFNAQRSCMLIRKFFGSNKSFPTVKKRVIKIYANNVI